MPKSVLDFPNVGTVAGTDVLYVIKGTDIDRDKHVTLSQLSSWLGGQLSAREFRVTGTGSVTVDLTGTPFALLHTTAGVTGVVLGGTVLPGAQIVVVNGSGAAITIAPAGYNAITNALAEGNSAATPYSLFNDGDAAVIFKVATIPGWQTFRILAEKGLEVALAKLALPLAVSDVGGSSAGSIPVEQLTVNSPGVLRNVGYVYFDVHSLIGASPRRFTVSSGGAKFVGFTGLSTMTMWTGTAGATAISRTLAGGDFGLTGRLVEIVWDGVTLLATVVLV